MVLRSPGPSLPSADIWMWPDKESCKVQSPGHSGHHLGRYKESSGTTAPVSRPSVHSYSLAQGDKERTTLETNINFLAKTSLHLWNIYKLWQSTISGYMFGILWRHFSFICAPFHIEENVCRISGTDAGVLLPGAARPLPAPPPLQPQLRPLPQQQQQQQREESGRGPAQER